MESFLMRSSTADSNLLPFKTKIFSARDIYPLQETSRFKIKNMSTDSRFSEVWDEAFQIYGEKKNSINYSYDFILELPNNIKNANLIIDCIMSAEGSYDKGYILLDDVEKHNFTTSGNYTRYTRNLILHAGNNKLTFSYNKDGSSSSNDDSFYILGMICCYK